MIKSFFTDDEETGIDWLDIAIHIANSIVEHIIQEIENSNIITNGRMAELGNATALNTVEP